MGPLAEDETLSTKITIRSLALTLGVGALVSIQACAQHGADAVQTDLPDESIAPAGCDKSGCVGVQYSKCAPVEPASVHGDKSSFYGNARLAQVTNDTVPCVHGEKGSVATCKFTANSGAYIVAKQGVFARTGQNIGLDGSPGGDYVVASKVTDATVPCIAPKGKDTAGTPAGVELAAACIVETMNAATNATGLKVVSFASLEVCTTSNPHPDGAALSSVTAVGGTKVYCYKGPGAGLNDINGIEIDPMGTYYTGTNRCHVIWSNGYEVPGSKRPSTKNLPPPGTIVTTTPIAWRPVTQVDVANP